LVVFFMNWPPLYDVGGETQVQLLGLEVVVGAVLVGGDDDAVEADLDLDDVLDALGGAGVEFGLLHRTRGVGDVGEAFAGARAEQLDAAAGAQRFDLRGLLAGLLGVVFGDAGREREHGRRAGGPDIVTGGIGGGGGHARKGDDGGRAGKQLLHGRTPGSLWSVKGDRPRSLEGRRPVGLRSPVARAAGIA
jgi:hypothetical protein